MSYSVILYTIYTAEHKGKELLNLSKLQKSLAESDKWGLVGLISFFGPLRLA